MSYVKSGKKVSRIIWMEKIKIYSTHPSSHTGPLSCFVVIIVPFFQDSHIKMKSKDFGKRWYNSCVSTQRKSFVIVDHISVIICINVWICSLACNSNSFSVQRMWTFIERHLWSISSTLKAQILRMKAFFSSYHLALNKILYKKCVRKTLMKLTPKVRSSIDLRIEYLLPLAW